jgi:hypothetical protein
MVLMPSPSQVITSANTFYIRFQSSTECPNTAVLNIKLKSPKKSGTLTDKLSVQMKRQPLMPEQVSHHTFGVREQILKVLQWNRHLLCRFRI